MEQPNCKTCGKCSNVSKGVYRFDDDLVVGQTYEELIADCLIKSGAVVEKQAPGYLPDLLVTAPGKKPYFLEIKTQGRAFMSIGRTCPESGLEPWETVVVNHSVFQRYIELWKAGNRVYLLFCVYDRPCLGDGFAMFVVKIKTLATIYERQGRKNLFLREQGEGDVDGDKYCCRSKYHFSIQDMKPVRFPV